MAEINRRLNLVVGVEREDGSTLYVHSMPLRRETFERYYLVMARAFAEIYSGGLNWTVGPRVAHMVLKDKAVQLGAWEGTEGVQAGLMSEIRRLANAIVLGPNGWAPMPLDQALSQGLISEDDASEVMGAVVFFILGSALHKRTEAATMLRGAAGLWGAETTLLNCTEYARSLPISTETENGTKSESSDGILVG